MFDINNIDVSSLFKNNSGASKLVQYDNPFVRKPKKKGKKNKVKKSRFHRHFKKI